MKIRGAKNNAASQQSQGVTPGMQAAEGAGGNSTNLRREFQGVLATFAGNLGDANSYISLDTFQVDPLLPQIPTDSNPVPAPASNEPTDVQTAMQASAIMPVKQDLQNEQAPQRDAKHQELAAPEIQKIEKASAPAAAAVPAGVAQQPVASTQTDSKPAVEPEAAAAQPQVSLPATQEISDQQLSGESYAQPQNPAPVSTTPISQEVTESAPAAAPEQIEAAPAQPVAESEPVAAAPEAHPVSQPKEAQPGPQAPTRPSVAASAAAPAPRDVAPVSSQESAGQGVGPVVGQTVKAQVHEALAKILENFAPAEVAPKDTAQSNPAIPVLAQVLKDSMASQILGSSQRASEAISRSAVADRTMMPMPAQNNALLGVGAASAGRSELGETRSPRPLPPGAATRVMERVEQTLKEVARSKDGKTISLVLTPSDLGKVKVDVTLKEGSLHARLGAESAQVAQLLRDRAPELQAMLRKLGLNVDKVTVAVHSENQSFSQMHDQLERQSTQNGKQGGGNGLGSGTAATALPMGAVAQEQPAVIDHWVA